MKEEDNSSAGLWVTLVMGAILFSVSFCKDVAPAALMILG